MPRRFLLLESILLCYLVPLRLSFVVPQIGKKTKPNNPNTFLSRSFRNLPNCKKNYIVVEMMQCLIFRNCLSSYHLGNISTSIYFGICVSMGIYLSKGNKPIISKRQVFSYVPCSIHYSREPRYRNKLTMAGDWVKKMYM